MELSTPTKILISKYSGCGNTFFLVDNREGVFSYADVATLCHNQVDGLIALEKSSDPKLYPMRIFNCDGGEAEMCGNGVRCFVQFLSELGIEEKEYRISTRAGELRAWKVGEEIAVKMSQPCNFKWDLHVLGYPVQFLNTGVPHAVLFVEDVEKAPVQRLGPLLRDAPVFGKSGTNVNFVQLLGSQQIAIRTFERGVGETLACGTGSVAAAIATAKKFNYHSPIRVNFRSRESVVISFEGLDEVLMQGRAKKLEILELDCVK